MNSENIMFKVSSLLEVILFATKAHHNQLRKYTDEPYIVHPLHVASILYNYSPSYSVMVAGILHDVVEDTDVTLEYIRLQYGHVVADLVQQVTNITVPEDGNRAERNRLQVERLSKVSSDAQTIKLADIYSNLCDWFIMYENKPKFASIYLQEKKDTLKVLTRGNTLLYNKVYKKIQQLETFLMEQK